MANEIEFKEKQAKLNARFLEVVAEIIRLNKARNEKEFWCNLQVYSYTQKKYKIKNNVHQVSADLLLKINDKYNVSVDYLFGKSNVMFCLK